LKPIIHIVGNRPQFIKLAVLYHELASDNLFTQKIIHTGQHFSHEMSDLFFEELNIPKATINLNINNLTDNLFIAKAADELQHYFSENKNCIAFVYGDTNTTLAAAIAAKRSSTTLVHFEAGVRTGDMSMPEEMNRLITDRLADINLCCTAQNYATMKSEGYGTSISSALHYTGDLMLDAFNKLGISNRTIVNKNEYVAATIHRASNIGNSNNLHEIIDALNTINKKIPVIVPLHPHTKKMIGNFDCKPLFKTLPPLGYLDMKSFLSSANFIITDSGGTCREAYFLHKKTLIIMGKPFWPEIIEANCALSAPADKELIVKQFFALPNLQPNFNGNIFGDGNAAAKIKKILSGLIH
jgi:UDP-GlcNAc3NAcA epimerase